MILEIDADQGTVVVRDAADLQRLDAQVTGKGSVASALGELGDIDPDGIHIWVDIAHLREAAAPDETTDWGQRFDAMIAYATKKGWIDAAGKRVRVHLS